MAADPVPDRYVIHLGMPPELDEDALLQPPALMEDSYVAWVRSLVGDDDLEPVPVFKGSEQVGLDELLVLLPDPPSDGDEVMASIP